MIDPEKVQKRVQRMSEGELLDWLEVAVPGMQRHLEAYRRTRNIDHLGELVIAEMTASIVVQELMTRKFPGDESDERTPARTAPSEPRTDSGTTSVRRLFRRGQRE